MTVDGYTTDMGMTAAENILTAHPEVVAILGINDSGALGAYETCVAQGVDTDKFYIGGNDGTQQALELIKEGTIYRGSVDLNPVGTGELMIQYAVSLCNGESIPESYMVPVTTSTSIWQCTNRLSAGNALPDFHIRQGRMQSDPNGVM